MSNRPSWGPFGGMTRFRDEMGDLINRFGLEPLFGTGTEVMLPVDVTDNDEEVMARVEIPGVKVEDVDVSVAGSMLTIKGHKKQETSKKESGVFRQERSFGSFTRSILLPCEVDAVKTDATFKDGVLEITMPKVAAAKSHRVEVK